MYKEVFVFSMGRAGSHAMFYWIGGEYDVPVRIVNKRAFSLYFDPELCKCKGYMLMREGTAFLSPFYEMAKKKPSFLELEDRIIVLTVRDPYNQFADWLQLYNRQVRRGKETEREKRRLIHQVVIPGWKEFAREAIGLTHYLPKGSIVVKFNDWFSSLEYRKQLASKLGLELYDRKLNIVSNHGPGGDSFFGMKYDGRAQEMDVLDRWRRMVGHKQYIGMFDKEIVELSDQLFSIDPVEITQGLSS